MVRQGDLQRKFGAAVQLRYGFIGGVRLIAVLSVAAFEEGSRIDR